MEKKEIKRVLERIYRFLKDNKGRFYVDDCETVTLYEGMSEIIDQEPEEKTVEERMKEVEIPYMETAKLEEWNENERRKRDKLAMDMLDNAYKLHYVKDTPEEWGELKEILDEYTIYADCFPTTPTNAVKARKNLENKIQQLLEDKEREVVQKVVNETRNMERLSIKQGISGEKAMKRLRNLIESLYEFNLLNNKKK